MIIQCLNCSKKFNVNSDLIIKDGRQIKCGSCNHSWYFKKENSLEEPLTLSNKNDQEDFSLIKNNVETKESISALDTTPLTDELTVNKSGNTRINLNHENKISGKKINNFFSYLLVFIISFVAFIILIDTLKSPLINLVPDLEIILFNLFETLKDIKLFIKDLT